MHEQLPARGPGSHGNTPPLFCCSSTSAFTPLCFSIISLNVIKSLFSLSNATLNGELRVACVRCASAHGRAQRRPVMWFVGKPGLDPRGHLGRKQEKSARERLIDSPCACRDTGPVLRDTCVVIRTRACGLCVQNVDANTAFTQKHNTIPPLLQTQPAKRVTCE